MDINEKTIKLLVAAGHVTEEKVEQARHLAKTLKWEDENASQQPLAPDANESEQCNCSWHLFGGKHEESCATRAGKA